MADDALVVLVHDAARPLVTDAVIERVLAPLSEGWDGVVPGLPVADTVKSVDGDRIVGTAPREKLVAVQTPQAFPVATLRDAYAGDLADATDCASLVESRGGRVKWVEGDPRLLKVTTRADLELVGVVAVKAVVFDVGETLIDETRLWERAADAAGTPRFTLMGVVGGLAARGEHHRRAWEILGVEQPAATWGSEDFYADALPCLVALRRRGVRVGAVGNTLTAAEDLLREHVDLVGSSARWGVEKPAPAFFERIVFECGVSADEIAYVGDRVDNDVEPALAAGMVAVHVRRGPWGHLHDPPPAALRVAALGGAARGAGCLSSGSG